MNAVNLIPVERRYTGLAAPGVPFLGLLAALVLALVGTVTYVGARDLVSTRQDELSHVRAGAAEWSAAGARYAPAVAAARHRAKGFAQLGALLGQRYDWSVLLGQLAGVMPAHAELSSLSAAAPSASDGAAAAVGGDTSTPGITISGCAASQSVVADTMVALRGLSGVSGVSLSSSSLQATAGSGSAAAGGACDLPVNFSLTLAFAPAASAVTLSGGAKSTAGASATTTGTETSDSTGAAQ